MPAISPASDPRPWISAREVARMLSVPPPNVPAVADTAGIRVLDVPGAYYVKYSRPDTLAVLEAAVRTPTPRT